MRYGLNVLLAQLDQDIDNPAADMLTGIISPTDARRARDLSSLKWRASREAAVPSSPAKPIGSQT